MEHQHAGFIYIMRATGTPYYKVGYSADPKKRLRSIRRINPAGIELLHTIKTNDMKGCEKYLHDFLSCHHHAGEWFTEVGGYMEWFQELSEAATVKDLHDHLYIPY